MASKDWQLANDAAERYEAILVPSILGPFAKALVDFADLRPGMTVVDVGCGTGAATRFAAEKIGDPAQVTGTDVNAAMLSVAGARGRGITWLQEPADQLSMADGSVDAVLCAQSLQFFKDRPAALAEMRRVLKPGGAASISLWCKIDKSPYFDALVRTVAEHISEDTAGGLRAAFNLSDAGDIHELLRGAGFNVIEITVAEIALPLPPAAEFVPRHIGATPMGVGFNAAPEPTQTAIVHAMTEQMRAYAAEDGLSVPFRSHLIRAS